MQAPPHACALPVPQAPPAGHATATSEFLRQHLPRNAAPQDKHNPRQGGAIRNTARSSALWLGRLRGYKWRDDFPQCIADQWRTHAANLPHSLGSVRRT
jgi:hypothetical protein